MRIAMLLMAIAAAAVGSPAAVAQSTSRRLTFAAAALGSVGLQHRLPAADARRSKKAPPKKKAAAPLGVQSAAAKALLKQGKDAQRMGSARALAHFDQATDAALADGDSATAARAHGAAGRLLLSVGEGGQAVERLGQAVAADPSYSAGHLNLAHAHLTNGDHRRGQSA
jgi:hypothetical protein|eukprot:COSAG06_NODE_6094_length_3114_cov_1.773466_5_plen_169_part_00